LFPNHISLPICARQREQFHVRHFVQSHGEPNQIHNHEQGLGAREVDLSVGILARAECIRHVQYALDGVHDRHGRDRNRKDVEILPRHPQHESVHRYLLPRRERDGHGVGLLSRADGDGLLLFRRGTARVVLGGMAGFLLHLPLDRSDEAHVAWRWLLLECAVSDVAFAQVEIDRPASLVGRGGNFCGNAHPNKTEKAEAVSGGLNAMRPSRK